MGYEELTPDDLATLYLDRPEERERIEQHVTSLSEYQQGYFKHLVEGQEQLPFRGYTANNMHTKRDGRVLWSDLYSFDNLVWHYQQQKEDLLANSPAPNLTLFIDRAIANAAAARTKLVESYNESGSVDDDDRYSLYVGEYDRFKSFLEEERAAQEKPTATAQIKAPVDAHQPKPTLRALALYCYYLQVDGQMAGFDEMQEGKEMALKRITGEHGFTSTYSWKSFQGIYNHIHLVNERITPTRERLKSLETAIAMLKEYPEALALAEREYKTAMSKRNHLT